MKESIKAYQREYQRNRYRSKNPVLVKYMEATKESRREYQREYRIKNKEKIKQYREENKEKHRLQNKERHQNKKAHANQISRDWYSKNRERKKEYTLANRDKFRVAFNKWRKSKFESDVNYKIACLTRNRIKSALKNGHKSASTAALIGCSIQELRIFIEAKFLPGMSWDNYGYRTWHIDHIIPCAAFNLADPEQQKKCFHYSNLQPLWAKDNMRKGARLAA